MVRRAWEKFRGWPTWAQWVVGVFLVLVVLAALVPTEDDGEETVSTAQTPTTSLDTTSPTTSPPTTAPAPTTTTTVRPTTTTAAGPKTTFGDGTHRVGVDIAPGTYVAPGGSACYWERQSSFGGGGVNAIIANDISSGGQVVVTIAATDKGFQTRGCGTWRQG